MKDNFRVLVLAFLVASLLLPLFTSAPIYAKDTFERDPQKLNPGDVVILDKNTRAEYLGKVNGKYTFKATIGMPLYLDDLVTKIDPRWGYDKPLVDFYTRANLFYAEVTDTKVTVSKDGKTLTWDPVVYVGGSVVPPYDKRAWFTLSDALGNPNYTGNTLTWSYPGFSRYLRVIEGVLSEFYIFTSSPGADVRVSSGTVKGGGFNWDRPAFAYDAKGTRINITASKLVKASEFARADITYPVIIDPTTTYTTSASDGYTDYIAFNYVSSASSWSETRDATSAQEAVAGSTLMSLFTATYYSGTYWETDMYRPYVFFDTSGLPDGASITAATLKLYGTGAPYVDYGAWTMQIQSGMPTYPSDPLVVADYAQTKYSGNGGTLASGSMSATYISTTLSATGRGWISKTGTTKFILRNVEQDINNSNPGHTSVYRRNSWQVYSYEQGNGYWPLLEVVYTASTLPTVTTQDATDVSISTATMHAYLNDDGGEPSQMRWEYDTNSGDPYAYNTTWLGNNTTTYLSGQSASQGIINLTYPTTYYFRAQAKNTLGISSGSEMTFATLSSLNAPTNLTAIPRSGVEVSLGWTKGVGSSRTVVRYKVGEYPTTTSDGSLAANITQSSYALTGLVAGTTYYFKAWGWDAGYSAGNVTEMATTLAASVATNPITIGNPPANFFTADISKLGNIPFYANFNGVADKADIPRTTLWAILAMGLAAILGTAGFMMTKQPIFALLGAGIGMFGAYNAGAIPGFMLMLFVILGGAMMWTLVGSKG